MTAPIRSMPELVPYRLILDYEAIEDMFLDRIEDLNTTFTQIDDAGGLTRGETQKLLSKSRERWARTLGITSMGKMLKGTGMVLVAVVDDERFAAIKEQLVARKRPRKQAEAKQVSKEVLEAFKMGIIRANGALGGRRRMVKLSKRQRTLIAKAGARARWSRKRTRRSDASPAE